MRFSNRIAMFLIQPWRWPGYVLRRLCDPLPWGAVLSNFIFQRILRVNSEYSFPINFTSRVTGDVVIGKDVWKSFAISGGCYIQGGNGITIGDHTIFAPGTKIISSNHSSENYNKWDSSPPIRIGKHVWVGANVVILPGVQIGDEVVIGANAVVTKNIPSGAITAGNPARILKMKVGYPMEGRK